MTLLLIVVGWLTGSAITYFLGKKAHLQEFDFFASDRRWLIVYSLVFGILGSVGPLLNLREARVDRRPNPLIEQRRGRR